ncbi:MAG TPA: PIN domain-containing protein [Armatimonadota bacterium]|nr:PIN domain-containing protein [Armatimonadota bacterium]
MRLLDTNVILRFLLNDHPVHSPRAHARLSRPEGCTVTPHILVEVAVVLEKVYRLDRTQIVAALRAFIAQESIEILGLTKPTVDAALLLCQPSGRVGFADAFLWAEARQIPGATVLTFDARFPPEHPDPLWRELGAVAVEAP